ncbi:MAG: class I SAM-dependent methyltransferase [Sphingomonadales bacterium]|nr:MAG: class I SAM-dependent methyltransferase [Sphingomonadales bacterium]
MTDPAKPNDMRDHWERTAEQYEAEGDVFTSRFAREAWRLADRSPGTKILDIATGVGALLLPALRDGADAHAIDFSDAMVARARRRAAEIDPAAAERVVRMDGQALDYPDASFDAAFSIFGVILFPDPDAGLAEMARVLRPGGMAVVGAWQSATGAGPAVLFQEALAELFPQLEFGSALGNRPLFNTPELMEAGFARAGLETQAVHFVTRPWATPEPDWPRKNAQLAFGWSPAWQALDDADRERMIEAVEARLRTGVQIEATALIGIGTKRHGASDDERSPGH